MINGVMVLGGITMESVGIYIRLSKEDSSKVNEESESIQNQRAILESYAKSQGWQIYDFYVDEDWSGSDRGRPEFHRLIQDAKNRKFNIVLVKTQSRFARDSKYIEDYVHNLFMEKGIRFVSLVDNIDTNVRGSKLNSRVHAIFDEEQLDLLSSNIRKSFEEKAKQGQFFGSMPPYGYKKDPCNKNHLIIDEEAARVVKIIFEMTAYGYTYKTIAKYLNDSGYLIPSEYKKQHGYNVDGMYDWHTNIGRWTRDMVRNFISNEVYKGTIVNHKSTVVNFRTKKKQNLPKDRRIKVHDMHEAIIDDELWNKVQEIKRSRRRASSDKKGVKHSLAGKVFCDVCGAKMYKCKSGGIEYFRCYRAASTGECTNNKRVRIDALERIVAEKINEIISLYINKEYLNRNIIIVDHFDKQLAEYNLRKNEFVKSISDNKLSMKKLLKAYMDGVVDRSIYEEMQSDYILEKEKMCSYIESIETEIKRIEKTKLKQENKDSIINKYSNIERLTVPIVSDFIETIRIGDVDDESLERKIIINMSI